MCQVHAAVAVTALLRPDVFTPWNPSHVGTLEKMCRVSALVLSCHHHHQKTCFSIRDVVVVTTIHFEPLQGLTFGLHIQLVGQLWSLSSTFYGAKIPKFQFSN